MFKKKHILVGAIILILVFTAGSVFGSMHGEFEGYPIVKMFVDGEEVKSDVPAVILEGRTVVPVRFVAEELGAAVEWDAEDYAVYIYSNDEPPTVEPEPEPEPNIFPPSEEALEIIKQNAHEKWGDDYSMVQWEIEQQTEAYDWLVEQTEYMDIMANAYEKWRDNYTMVKYEYEQQVEAYEEIS